MAFDPTKYSEIFNSFDIELCFEFNSYYSVQKTASLLGSHLNKMIDTTNDKLFTPNEHTFQLRCNSIFANPYCNLKTGKLQYQEARFVIIKMFEQLREYGFTGPDNFVRVKLSTSGNQQMIPMITNIDRLKFILDFDESFTHVKFDNLKDSAFVRSMYNIVPINKRLTDIEHINSSAFTIPNGSIYGIDFTKFAEGSIGFNYIGGVNYEKKTIEALDVLDYYMLAIAKTTADKNYNKDHLNKLNTILDDIRDVLQGYEGPAEFKKQFPDIKLTVDLTTGEQVLKSFWDKIKDKIFDLLANSDIKVGQLNYDTHLSRMQIKDMDFTSYNLVDYEIVDCKIHDSAIGNCNIYRTEIKDTRIERTNLYGNTELLRCKAKDNFFNKSVTAKDCYVWGKSTVFNGEMDGGVFKEGNKGRFSTFKPNVKIVKYTEIAPAKMKITND